jgi:hypothetical protein
VLPDGVQSARGRVLAAPVDHVQGRVDALDVETFGAQVEQGVAVSAPDLQTGLPRRPDEVGVGLGREGRGLELGVGVDDDPRVEVRSIHPGNLRASES